LPPRLRLLRRRRIGRARRGRGRVLELGQRRRRRGVPDPRSDDGRWNVRPGRGCLPLHCLQLHMRRLERARRLLRAAEPQVPRVRPRSVRCAALQRVHGGAWRRGGRMPRVGGLLRHGDRLLQRPSVCAGRRGQPYLQRDLVSGKRPHLHDKRRLLRGTPLRRTPRIDSGHMHGGSPSASSASPSE
jgi:hypothetical protein